MKYIITEKQLTKFIRKYLDSIELNITRRRDGGIWIEDNSGNEIFNYYEESNKTYLYVDPFIWETVRGMFNLDNLSARMEILMWFEDKFDRRVDYIELSCN